MMLATMRAREASATRVLFIGNSYTYFNNLPEIFAKLAEAGHAGNVETRMVAPGGWRLKDHWEKGAARELLANEKWDFVVLQDQSALGTNYWLEGKDHVWDDTVFRPYAEKWAAEVRAHGARPVFFLTWAGKDTPEDQATLNYAYARAAKDTGSLLSPVGMAWDDVRREQPSLVLFYEGHGSHPSPAGSYLAGCVFYSAIFHRTPVGLPSKVVGTPVNLDTEKQETGKSVTLVDLNSQEANLLQEQAWRTWQRISSNGGYPDITPAHPPSLEPLPAGLPLSAASLDGTWRGSLRFYPIGPVEMLLRIQSGQGLKAHLEIKYHSKDFPDESIELPDFRIEGSDLSFSDPKSSGVDNLAMRVIGVMPKSGELKGTAEADKETAEAHVRLLGTWTLTKE
jgi:hypothetical protein